MRNELGRITKASFGFGGYQDAMIGLSIDLGGESWSCSDFKGGWAVDRNERCQWSEQDRLNDPGNACMYLRNLLTLAKKQHVSDLVNLPIEATFDGNMLVSWRILVEVLP